MPGAGSYIAGSGAAGVEQVSPSGTRIPPTLPTAYDPRSRAIPLNSDGSIAAAHWVDQSMALCLTNALGSIPARPDLGVDRVALRRATKITAASVVESVVLAAIDHLIKRNAVEILLLAHVWRSGQLGYLVRYRNLFLPSNVVRTVEG